MNRFAAAKLHLSKWTAVRPRDREKHFIVTQIFHNTEGAADTCLLEAVHSRREQLINWKDLRNSEKWRQGWQ